MPSPRPCPHCQAPLVEGAAHCGACGQSLFQQTLIGVPAVKLPGLAAPAATPAADRTAIGPPTPVVPSWAPQPAADEAAPTLLDSRPNGLVATITPAGGHPALPKPVAEVVSTATARPQSRLARPTTDLRATPSAPPGPRATRGATPSATPRATHASTPNSRATQASTPRAAARASSPRQPDPSRDSIAAARIREAAEATERAARADGRRRGTRHLAVVAALAITIALVAFWATRFRAELAGDLSVTRTSSGYAVNVGVRTSGPATVRHPGGAAAVDGVARLRFEMASAQMALGDNTVVLDVESASGAQRALTLHVMVYYHLRAPRLTAPVPGQPVEVLLELGPGWSATLHSPGTAEPLSDGRVRLRLDATAALATATPDHDLVLPVDFTLKGPDGTEEHFVEKLRLPAPRLQLAVAAPVRGWALAAESVQVVGRAAPNADLTVGAARVKADATGRFEARVPLPTVGAHRVRIESLAPRPGVVEIDVRRLSPRAADERRREALATLPRGTRPPDYATLLTDDVPRVDYNFEGALLSVRRGSADAPDSAQVATCVGQGGCVVWAELGRAPLVPVGSPVRLVGRLDGRARYATRSGTEIDVPRLVDAWVVPR